MRTATQETFLQQMGPRSWPDLAHVVRSTAAVHKFSVGRQQDELETNLQACFLSGRANTHSVVPIHQCGNGQAKEMTRR
ncbi:hypothetical protein L345_11011, partial [Ophiophagus hannah]